MILSDFAFIEIHGDRDSLGLQTKQRSTLAISTVFVRHSRRGTSRCSSGGSGCTNLTVRCTGLALIDPARHDWQGAKMAEFTLHVNGAVRTIEADGNMPLLWALRDLLELTGTKYGCGIGMCGACTVHLNSGPVRSCQTTLADIRDQKITTIEGLGKGGLHHVQKAWIAEQAPQCGYCQSGQIMSAAALLASNPNPTDSQIDDAMGGNICRCGTYFRIRKAIHRAAQETRS
jgi:isoquinoline 1-oxidoreductase alpha subunit